MEATLIILHAVLLSVDFFKLNFFEYCFQECHKSVYSLYPDQARRFFLFFFLQMLSANVKHIQHSLHFCTVYASSECVQKEEDLSF